MNPDDKLDALARLASIEGHLRGIRKMVEEEQRCTAIIKQTRAVKRALDKFDELLVRGHLRREVPDGFEAGRGAVMVEELEELFGLFGRDAR